MTRSSLSFHCAQRTSPTRDADSVSREVHSPRLGRLRGFRCEVSVKSTSNQPTSRTRVVQPWLYDAPAPSLRRISRRDSVAEVTGVRAPALVGYFIHLQRLPVAAGDCASAAAEGTERKQSDKHRQVRASSGLALACSDAQCRVWRRFSLGGWSSRQRRLFALLSLTTLIVRCVWLRSHPSAHRSLCHAGHFCEQIVMASTHTMHSLSIAHRPRPCVLASSWASRFLARD